MTAVDASLDERIADCTAVIEHGGPTAPQVVTARFRRAAAYFRKGDIDHAIADYDNVIRQSSADLRAAYDYADLDLPQGKAIPTTSGSEQTSGRDRYRAQAYRGRGIASFQAGLLEQSQDDFRHLSAMDQKDARAALWLDLARRRAGLASVLADQAKLLDMSKWPAPIVRVFLGQGTAEAALAAAEQGDPVTRKARRCEASFFAGELMLQQGQDAGAMRLIDRALAECSPASGVRSVADAEARILRVMP
ncbi:hypothetical protein ACQR1W_19945 [Bradyrhizobium sp. HKCCYLS1011]|uniref:hypothetical protein n=1 Tax=Bradyrhizobium sp. HKCCYLS1011 TaxID=3420733 RepID=UPI003EB6C653